MKLYSAEASLQNRKACYSPVNSNLQISFLYVIQFKLHCDIQQRVKKHSHILQYNINRADAYIHLCSSGKGDHDVMKINGIPCDQSTLQSWVIVKLKTNLNATFHQALNIKSWKLRKNINRFITEFQRASEVQTSC